MVQYRQMLTRTSKKRHWHIKEKMMVTIAFYIFAVLITGLFLITVMSKNILYAMTSLAAGMVLISGLFFVLGADFLGVVQLIVYVGAVMGLYAFAMMFFDLRDDVKEKIGNPWLVFLLGGGIALVLVVIFSAPIMSDSLDTANMIVDGKTYENFIDGNISRYAQYSLEHGVQASVNSIDNPKSVGVVLFTKYLLPFEVASIMLLIAMISGIVLAGKKMQISLSDTDDENMIDTKDDE
jgi:NADH-quinone oxidoreductase subunit J